MNIETLFRTKSEEGDDKRERVLEIFNLQVLTRVNQAINRLRLPESIIGCNVQLKRLVDCLIERSELRQILDDQNS